MKPLLTDHHLLRRALRVLSAVGCLLSAGAASASEPPSMLTYAWRAEATRPAEVAVTIRQGETLRLACTLLERSKPIAVPDDATSRFFWRDADAKGNYWAKEATRQGSELAFVWTAACDVGAKRYDFVLSLESPTAGTLYRASGLLIMQSSPGFNPASLQPPDVFAEIVAATQAAILEVAATKVDLSAEAQAREEADSAITQAVNALQGNLAAHNHDGTYLKLTGGTMSGTILSALSKASDPGLTITLGQGDRYYAKHTQAGIQARRARSDPEEFYAFFSVSGTNQIARLGDLEPLATKAALASKAALDHTHEMGDVDGLETALASKAALEHTHSQYLTSYTESDPTIAAWAKAATKPTYNWTEILNRPTTWDWANLTNKPTTFTPATHNHDGTYLKLSGGTVTGTLKAPEIDMNVDNSIYHFNIKASPSNDIAPVLGFYIGQGDTRVAGFSPGATDTRLSFIKGEDPRNQKVAFGHNLTKDRLFIMKNAYIADAYMGDRNWWTFSDYGNELRIVKEDKSPNEYAPADHTHAIADTTGLQAALDSLAPLSSVTCTTNDVTYIWQWDEEAGTFALVER